MFKPEGVYFAMLTPFKDGKFMKKHYGKWSNLIFRMVSMDYSLSVQAVNSFNWILRKSTDDGHCHGSGKRSCSGNSRCYSS